MANPVMTIKTSPNGLDCVTIRVERKNPELSLAFLQKLLPALEILDRQSRDSESLEYKRRKQS